MSANDSSTQGEPASIPFEPDTACESCGRFGAFRLDGRVLCGECIAGSGSCCPEFGKDDLWTEHDR